MKSIAHLFTCCVILVFICSIAYGQDAGKIVTAMTAKYESFESFECSGKCQPKIGKPFPFSIFFSRPDRMRIDWVSIHPYAPLNIKTPMQIISNKEKTVMTNAKGEFGTAKSLRLALAGHSGISTGVSHIIPRMLLPNLTSGLHLGDLTNFQITGNITINGIICYEVIGLHPKSKQKNKLYIGQEDHLLHRYESLFAVIEFDMIKYDIAIEGEIFDIPRK